MTRLLNWLPWRRRRLEADLQRELAHHMTRRVEDLVHDGMSEVDARRQASLELGGVPQVQEAVRDTWTWRWLDNLQRDFRYAARVLVRAPSFTAAAIVSLALGIGANAAIFSLADRVLRRQLPVPHPERLVLLSWEGNAAASLYGAGTALSYPVCRELQALERLFDGVFCRYTASLSFSTGQQHEMVRAEIVSGTYFAALGVQPELGRLLSSTDDVEPGEPAVVLSFEFWQNRFGGDRRVIGRRVLINNQPMQVVGVAPARFRGVDFGAVPKLWIPALMAKVHAEIAPIVLHRRSFWMQTFARLRPDVTIEQARSGLQPWFWSMLDADLQRPGFPTISEEQRRRYLASTLELESAARGWSVLRSTLERPLYVLIAGTLLLLTLASLNVAGLLIARGAARSRELTTRMALGASRARLVTQLLSESILLSVGGGLLGLALAPVLSALLLSFVGSDVDASARVDLRVLLFAFLGCLVTGIVCGIAPALQTGRLSLVSSLKEKSRIGGGVRLRKALVIGQLSFALILLIGAGLFVRTLTRLYAKGPGFDPAGIVMFRLDPTSVAYSEDIEADRVMREMARALGSLPGVVHAAVANTSLLGTGSSTTHFTIQSDTRVTTDRPVPFMRVGAGFFATLGTAIVAGRDFDERDARPPGTAARAPRVVIVNETFARKYFGRRNPVGSRLGQGNRPNVVTDIEIIGVVRDFNRRTIRESSEGVYFSFWNRNSGDGVFYLRTTGDPSSLATAIRATAARIAPAVPVVDFRTFEEQIDRSLTTERMLAMSSSAFGATALLLAVVGLYGVMSFVVTRRTQEIGVRLALGATRKNAVWLIAREAFAMVALGTLIALPTAWALTQLVEAHLFDVRPADATTMVLASFLLALVALGSAMFPAWRASSVSPTEALRFE
jgi:predicted permease